MNGYNPDGSYYDDPGVPDVAYFNGKERGSGLFPLLRWIPAESQLRGAAVLGSGDRLQLRPDRHVRDRLVATLDKSTR